MKMGPSLQTQVPIAAIVIVNYFKAPRLLDGLRSLARQSAAAAAATVVVENSVDAGERRLLAEAAGKVLLVEPASNLGYTKGCNLGVRSLPRTRYVVLCNPDIIWDQADTLEKLIAIADADPSIGVLAPLQFSDDGTPVETARSFPTLLEQVDRRLRQGPAKEPHIAETLVRSAQGSVDIDWVQSSCVLIRRTLWDQIEGLDERYFLFMSDVELGRATWAAGLRVCLTSAARVRADGKRASAGGFAALLTSPAQRNHLVDAIKYYLSNGVRRLLRPRRGAKSLAGSSATRAGTVRGIGEAFPSEVTKARDPAVL